MRSLRLLTRFVVLAVSSTVITFGTTNAVAAPCKKNIVVKDVGDATTPTSGQLRTAIAESCSGGTIHLPTSAVIQLTQGELVIPAGKVLTIQSPSHQQQATIDANGVGRVIWVQVNASLTLRNVIVRSGEVGINNDGSLTVAGGAVRDNTGVGIVNNGGGLVTLSGDTSVAANDFSGVFNLGDESDPARLTLEDQATITGNTGANGGGIFNTVGPITLNDQSSIYGNAATFGGGIYAGIGNVTLNDVSSIHDNEAAQEGGGIYNPAGTPIASNVLNDTSQVTSNVGGGIGGRGHITMNDDSTIADNVGDGIDNVRGGVIMNGRSSIARNLGVGVSAFGVGIIMNDESRITNNDGGGIGIVDASAHLNDGSAVTDNNNGGVSVFAGGVTLNGSSSISGNTTQGDGGGVAIEEGNLILNDDSSITGNVGRFGGGVYNANLPVDPSECPSICVTLNGSSTITGNHAKNGAGGGIYNANGGTVLVNDSSSITGNIPDDCFPAGSC